MAASHLSRQNGIVIADGVGRLRVGAVASPPMSARITSDDVAHVAKLARLELGPDEVEVFTGQLAAILEHAEDVEALDLADVPPTSHPYPLVNVLRPDEVGATLPSEEALAAAPQAEDGRFRVPTILGDAP
ncbi:MAG: aspartyl/glutamyl-tRNA(Asn/Gln) amidotransferase subunit [Acidimicrobiales bacterium]|nr:aspartyl/glutamyl-tRNA(Asn/Gln) amidotransferase subunit [Acidimicrobiales bacterium]